MKHRLAWLLLSALVFAPSADPDEDSPLPQA
jgi:hypothetical protein